MKFINRLIGSILLFIYLILVISVPLWWFLPFLLSGKSHKRFLYVFFDYIYNKLNPKQI